MGLIRTKGASTGAMRSYQRANLVVRHHPGFVVGLGVLAIADAPGASTEW